MLLSSIFLNAVISGDECTTAEACLHSSSVTCTTGNDEMVEEKQALPKPKFLAPLPSRAKPRVKQTELEGFDTPHTEFDVNQGQHMETKVGAANTTDAEELSATSLGLDLILLQPKPATAETAQNDALATKCCNQSGKCGKPLFLGMFYYVVYWPTHVTI